MSDSVELLRRELGAEPSEAVRELDGAEQERLAGLIASARKRQHAALEAAIDQGLSFVPRLARGAVKKALFG
jgi:hypothetical protein